MHEEGTPWWHLILTTHGSWLHGDPRGFRSRHHRIHSSGDYRNPPPAGEHAGLHRWHRSRSRDEIIIPLEARETAGCAMLVKCRKDGHRVLAIAVASTHAHVLVELSPIRREAVEFSSRLKQASSHAMRQYLPGGVWARGGKPINITSRAHHRRVFEYILKHSRQDAWTWNYRLEINAPQDRR